MTSNKFNNQASLPLKLLISYCLSNALSSTILEWETSLPEGIYDIEGLCIQLPCANTDKPYTGFLLKGYHVYIELVGVSAKLNQFGITSTTRRSYLWQKTGTGVDCWMKCLKPTHTYKIMSSIGWKSLSNLLYWKSQNLT